jgi:hypothetical protein
VCLCRGYRLRRQSKRRVVFGSAGQTGRIGRAVSTRLDSRLSIGSSDVWRLSELPLGLAFRRLDFLGRSRSHPLGGPVWRGRVGNADAECATRQTRPGLLCAELGRKRADRYDTSSDQGFGQKGCKILEGGMEGGGSGRRTSSSSAPPRYTPPTTGQRKTSRKQRIEKKNQLTHAVPQQP